MCSKKSLFEKSKFDQIESNQEKDKINELTQLRIVHPVILEVPHEEIVEKKQIHFEIISENPNHEKNTFNNENLENFQVLSGQKLDINVKLNDEKDSFCDSFFTISVPFNSAKIQHNTQNLKSSCGHENCSLFNSFKPDIIQRFPETNSRIEVNSIIANQCFPKGIKICLYPEKSEPKQIENFLIINTNENGERFYIMTCHFYLKYSVESLNKHFNMDFTKDYLNIEKENRDLELVLNQPQIADKITKNLQKKLKIISDLYFSDFVYIPMCFALASRFPYAKQMEKALESIYKITQFPDLKQEEVIKCIIHLIKEVPVPPPNNRLLFYLPLQEFPIQIYGNLYKNLPILNFSISIILEGLSIENILIIHQLMMNEQKIIFIGESIIKLTEIIEIFASLLYPLQWTYPYVPTLSEELLKYLQTPLPFVMGIDEKMFELAKEFLTEDEDIFIVNISKNRITVFNQQGKSKFTKSELLKNLPEFPEDCSNDILEKLRCYYTIFKNKHLHPDFDIETFDRKIRKVFIQSNSKLFGNFSKYLSMIDEVPIFNKESFVDNFRLKDRFFIEKLVDSQNFNYFLQLDTKKIFPYFYKVALRFSSSQNFKNTTSRKSNSISKTSTQDFNFPSLNENKSKDNNILTVRVDESQTRTSSSNDDSLNLKNVKKIKKNFEGNYIVPSYFGREAYTIFQNEINEKFENSNPILRVFENAMIFNFNSINYYTDFRIQENIKTPKSVLKKFIFERKPSFKFYRFK